MLFLFADLEINLQWKWLFRPRQRDGMTVDDYYAEFCNWKDEMISISFPAKEEDYIEGFIENLEWDIRWRSSKYESSRIGLTIAFYNEKFEESMMKLKASSHTPVVVNPAEPDSIVVEEISICDHSYLVAVEELSTHDAGSVANEKISELPTMNLNSDLGSQTTDAHLSDEELVINESPESAEMLDFDDIKSNDSPKSDEMPNLAETVVSESGSQVLSIYCAYMASKWNNILELRPKQRKDMSVEVYYDLFYSWKRKLDAVNYIGGEESYTDDFIYGLEIKLGMRVMGYKWKPRTLYGAFHRAEIEETLMKNYAHTVLEEMPQLYSSDIQGAENVSDEYGNVALDASLGSEFTIKETLIEVDNEPSQILLQKHVEQDEGKVVGGGIVPSWFDLQVSLGPLGDLTKAWHDEATLGIKNVPRKYAIVDDAYKEFGEMTQAIRATLLAEEVMKHSAKYVDLNKLILFDPGGSRKGVMSFRGEVSRPLFGKAQEMFVFGFKTKQNIGFERLRTCEPSMFGFKDASMKMMFGGAAMVMFDPDISSWHLKDCDSINSSEISGNLIVDIWLGNGMFCFDPGGCSFPQSICYIYDIVDLVVSGFQRKDFIDIVSLGRRNSIGHATYIWNFSLRGPAANYLSSCDTSALTAFNGYAMKKSNTGRFDSFDVFQQTYVFLKMLKEYSIFTLLFPFYSTVNGRHLCDLRGNLHEIKCSTCNIVNKRIRGTEFSQISFIRYKVSDIFMILDVLCQNAILLHILEDKEVFERVEKDIVLMDSILVIMSNWCNDSVTYGLMNGLVNTLLSHLECFRCDSITFQVCRAKSAFIWLRPILQMVFVWCVLNNIIKTSYIEVSLTQPVMLVMLLDLMYLMFKRVSIGICGPVSLIYTSRLPTLPCCSFGHIYVYRIHASSRKYYSILRIPYYVLMYNLLFDHDGYIGLRRSVMFLVLHKNIEEFNDSIHVIFNICPETEQDGITFLLSNGAIRARISGSSKKANGVQNNCNIMEWCVMASMHYLDRINGMDGNVVAFTYHSLEIYLTVVVKSMVFANLKVFVWDPGRVLYGIRIRCKVESLVAIGKHFDTTSILMEVGCADSSLEL